MTRSPQDVALPRKAELRKGVDEASVMPRRQLAGGPSTNAELQEFGRSYDVQGMCMAPVSRVTFYTLLANVSLWVNFFT